MAQVATRLPFFVIQVCTAGRNARFFRAFLAVKLAFFAFFRCFLTILAVFWKHEKEKEE